MQDPDPPPDPQRYVGYYRVSTAQQGRSGLGLEGQRIAVLNFLAKNQPARMLAEFTEVESGRKSDRERPQLAAALALTRRRKATLIVARIDRLGRNVALIARLLESKVDFVAADLPIADRLTIHIIAAVAEYEADLIAARRREALASARARGTKIGIAGMSPRMRASIVRLGVEAMARRHLEHARNTMPHILAQRRRGIRTHDATARALNAAGVPTFRGTGRWHRDTVRAVIRAMEPDFKVSRPPLSADRQRRMLALAVPATKAKADLRALALAPAIAEIEASGIATHRGIARELTRRGIPAPRGGVIWSNLTVRMIRARLIRLRGSSTGCVVPMIADTEARIRQVREMMDRRRSPEQQRA